MAKETEPTFWTSDAPPEDWEDLVKYVKPRTVEELEDYFAPQAPAPPDPNVPPTPDEGDQPQSLLKQLQLKEGEFVELALQQPELWTEEELDYLYLAASEGEVDERLDELAKDYFTGARHRQKAAPPPPSAPADSAIDTSIDQMPDLPGMTSIPDLETLEGTMNVDKWWEKQK